MSKKEQPVRVGVPMSKAARVQLTQRATNSGMSLSEYIRMCIDYYIAAESSGLAESIPWGVRNWKKRNG